ncbi:MAG: hypothetical protein QNK37_30415 [Acidobacteriota bacterium]|nr:hypothetical protein [Acidobacteriota bacterium]
MEIQLMDFLRPFHHRLLETPATPELAQFCAQLPKALRTDRKLQRDFPWELGLSRDFRQPGVPERKHSGRHRLAESNLCNRLTRNR